MPRHHVAVALLVPPLVARDVDVLRATLGATDLDRVAPHLTLIPPCSLREDDLPLALAVLREAAAASRPLTLGLGPVATFSPVTPTVHLAVGARRDCAGCEPDGDLADLRRLQGAADRGPLHRKARFPFVPHVTLLEQAPLHRIGAARLALDRVALTAPFTRLTLLSEVRDAGGPPPRWRPLADVDLGGVRILGRGGLPIELSAGTLVDPEARAALGLPEGTPPERTPARVPAEAVVVVARLDGVVVGAAWGDGPAHRRVVGPIDADVLTAAWLDRRRAA